MRKPREREDWNRRYAAHEFIRAVEANRFLVAEVADLPPGRALDLAPGVKITIDCLVRGKRP
jgi:hypothetical protein